MAVTSAPTGGSGDDLATIGRQLGLALAALGTPGAGAIGSLECRVADLQHRLLATPARSLADVEVRLGLIRDLVAGLGPAGYLLHLVEVTLADVRALTAASPPAGPPAAAGPGPAADQA